jgi:hypothetical protein
MKIVVCLALIVISFSCKKKDAEAPGINISLPLHNQNVNVGDSFYIEGLAVDDLGLKEVRYKIESPEGSYDWGLSGSIPVTGTNKIFKGDVIIPYEASVGKSALSFYSVDLEGKTSDVVSQTINLIDATPINITMYEYSGNDLDSVTVTVYKNENGIFDSLTIYNVTQATLIATGSDKGGFKSTLAQIDAPYLAPFPYDEYHDLLEIEEESYTMGYILDKNNHPATYDLGRFYFHEYLYEYSGSWRGHHQVEIDIL